MSFDLVVLALIMLIFCVFMQIFTVKVMFSLLNSVRPDEVKEIKPIKLIEKKPKKSEEQLAFEEKQAKAQREYETLMRNLDNFDGSGFGQEEVK